MLTSTFVYIAAITFAISFYFKRREILSPEMLVSLGYALPIPYLLVVSVFPSRANYVGYFDSSSYEKIFAIVVLLQVLVFLLVLAGIFFGKGLASSIYGLESKKYGKELPSMSVVYEQNLFLAIASVFFGFYLILDIVYSQAGGLINLWSNIGLRTQILSGSGAKYLMGNLFILIGISIVFMRTVCLGRQYVLFLIMFLISAFSLAVFGARGPVIKMVFLLIFLHHYYARPIKLSYRALTKFTLLGFVILIFIGIIAFVRKSQINDGVEDLDFVDYLVETLSHMSHIGTYMFIYDYFNSENIWYGYSYMNLLYFLGVIDAGGKVPLDDGRYVLGLMQYGSVNPVEFIEDLPGSSYPPGLWFGFMQFYFVGLFSFAFLAGIIKGAFYKVFLSSGRKLFMFFMMYYVGYPFIPTNFHIFSCALYASFFIVFFLLYGFFQKLTWRVR